MNRKYTFRKNDTVMYFEVYEREPYGFVAYTHNPATAAMIVDALNGDPAGTVSTADFPVHQG
jgi:hypothetical protein